MTAAQATADKAKTDAQIANENPLAKFDAGTLKGIGASDLTTGRASAFLPANVAEGMELAKLMASSNFVPPHLRGKPGDCMAVVMQSVRWEMDPFAVSSKTYFVQERMAYESQLVIAVINTRAGLLGRLQHEYSGEWPKRVLKITGIFRSDPHRPVSVEIKAETIKTRNSPLWQQQPDLQLYYYAARAWGRLHCPEVLLGVLTVDELQDSGNLVPGPDGTYQVIRSDAPPLPTRSSIASQVHAEKQVEADLNRSSDRMPDSDEERGDAPEGGDGKPSLSESKESDGAGKNDGPPKQKWITGDGEVREFDDYGSWMNFAMAVLRQALEAGESVDKPWQRNAENWAAVQESVPKAKVHQNSLASFKADLQKVFADAKARDEA